MPTPSRHTRTDAPQRRATHRGASAFAAAMLALIVCAASGCNIVGPAGYFLLGPEKTPQMYDLDRKSPTVVFVDDRASRVPDRAARNLIGKTTEQVLLDEKVVDEMISSEGLAAVVARERFGQPMGIAEVGQAVGAKTVIYVTVDEFTLSADGNTYAPRSAVRVKVIDADTKKRLWPADEPGWHGLTIQIPERQGVPPRTGAEINAAQRELASKVGAAVAKLFYKHETKPIGEKTGR